MLRYNPVVPEYKTSTPALQTLEALIRICSQNNKGVCFLQGAEWLIESDLPFTAAIHDRAEPEIVEMMWASNISYEHALGKACEAIGLIEAGSFPAGGKWFSQVYKLR